MKNPSLKTAHKLALAFGALAALVVLVSALGLRALHNGHEAYAHYVSDTSAQITLANEVLDATNARAIGARNLVLVTQASDKGDAKAAVTQAHDMVQKTLAQLKTALAQSADTTTQARQLLADIERVEAAYGPVALKIVDLALNDQQAQAIDMMNKDCRPLLAALTKAVGAFIAHGQQVAATGVEDAQASYTANRNTLAAISLIAIAMAALMAGSITRALSRALGAEPNELGGAARRVAQGDLSPLPGAAQAAAGSVLSSLGDMQANLARIVAQVRGSSDSIATGSAQIATGNADLSQRTEEQASSLQQTAASMEQMTATVRTNAGTARQATQLATGASVAATKGGQVVDQVVRTMQDITSSSNKIVDIISVIDGIAFQTNILALNAAVEAARAGEQGRGFAVVASEVRSLAQRSAGAAKEIKTLIHTSVQKVNEGSRLVGDAGVTMTDIVTQVRQVADLIAEISTATSEQTTGIGQVSMAVSQLDQVTQQNAALVEESAAAAESLKHQAAHLAQIMSTFKLPHDSVPPITAIARTNGSQSIHAACRPPALLPR